MWRSLLFVPTLEERFVAKAGSRGADALVLDLEASIAPDRKDEARKALPEAVNKLSADLPVTVRINPLWMAAIKDLEASVLPGVEAIHIAQWFAPSTELFLIWKPSGLFQPGGSS
jgi:citrate lyase subunit beta/citryl-CoA lyase